MTRVTIRLVWVSLLLLGAQTTNAQPGGGFAVGAGMHRTRGGTFEDPNGLLLDVLATFGIVKRANASLVLGVGGTQVFGDTAPECIITASGGCAPDGDTRGLNALLGLAAFAGPTELNVAVGPAWYWNDGAAQRGSQFRLDVLDKDEKIALGAMARLTLIPASQGVRRDMYAFGLYLRFR
jgi:hypothetical protein